MKERLYEILMDDDIVLSINKNMEELLTIIPEIKDTIGFEHNHPYHHLDVWQHTLYALSFASKDFTIRLSLLFHDIAKPLVCTTDNDGVRHFRGHPDKSSEIAYLELKRLGFDEMFINKICYLVKYHDTPISMEDIEYDLDLQKTRYIIQYCDGLAHNPDILYKKEQYLDKTLVLLNNHRTK